MPRPIEQYLVKEADVAGLTWIRTLVLMVAATLCSVTRAEECGLPKAQPETAGFSTERLQRLHSSVAAVVDSKALAGAITVLARHGRVLDCTVYGYRDLAGSKPMQLDTIFRIYSMSKPVTGVAMMILFEEGKWRPNDPISKYVPELASLQVYAGTDAAGNVLLESPHHAPTLGELMTHTAGFTYGVFGDTPVDKMYREKNPLGAGSLTEFAERLAKIPLLYQPGERWVYSVSVDLQGLIVERLSGKPLADFMREKIFAPLGMKDSGFFVPAEKLPRLASLYEGNAAGALVPVATAAVSPEPTRPPGTPSGGGGLFSTAADYVRFAQMLANGGELDGVRILSPSSVQLMRSNHLPERLATGDFGIGFYRMQPGLGYGYDVAVFDDPARVGSTAGRGSFLWDGAAATWFWVDPTNDVVFVGMTQRMLTTPGAPNMEDSSRALTYQALIHPEK
jgi:CubicO group peptidase (beta-lactamase class C family)